MPKTVPNGRNYRLYDKIVTGLVVVATVLCTVFLPMNWFFNAVLGVLLGGAIAVAYGLVRPSDEVVQLLELMADTVTKANKLDDPAVRSIIASIALTIYTEGVRIHKIEVRHLNELVVSALEGVSSAEVMPVLEEMSSQVEANKKRKFQQAQEQVEFLNKFYGLTGKTSESLKLLQEILQKNP